MITAWPKIDQAINDTIVAYAAYIVIQTLRDDYHVKISACIMDECKRDAVTARAKLMDVILTWHDEETSHD